MKVWLGFWSIELVQLSNARTGYFSISQTGAKLAQKPGRQAGRQPAWLPDANSAKLEIEDPYGRFVASDSKVNYPKVRY